MAYEGKMHALVAREGRGDEQYTRMPPCSEGRTEGRQSRAVSLMASMLSVPSVATAKTGALINMSGGYIVPLSV